MAAARETLLASAPAARISDERRSVYCSMRVIHLSTNDISGGAARAAYRLHDGLNRLGHTSRMLVVSRHSSDPTVVAVSRPLDLASRLKRGILQYRMGREFQRYRGTRLRACELFSDDRSEYQSALLEQMPAADVVNLHWVASFLDYRSFFQAAPRRTPVVWTLHDMNPFTGGCHYNLTCNRYLEACCACPQLGSEVTDDLSRQIWKRKESAFARIPVERLHIVAPSRWLAREVGRSALLGRFPVTEIPNGLDVRTFLPRDREPVRDLLGIPRSARVVLFVAEAADAPRKGFRTLVDALSYAAADVPNLYLLSLGSGSTAIDIPVPSLHLGFLDNDRFLSMVYSAADLFVICSVQDNLPNTVLEALACGVPVVGVDVGGIPDMVRSGKNGETAPAGDAPAIAKRIALLLNNEDLRTKMAAAARRIAVDEYSVELQARRYAELYVTLVKSGVGSDSKIADAASIPACEGQP